MSENVGILSTPNGDGSRFEVREDESIMWHGTWKDYISFPSGTIYWNKDDSNGGQICIFANTKERDVTESYTNNAGITLNNHLHTVNPGCFNLIARSPNKNRCTLVGTPDGQLTWCDKPVMVVESNKTISNIYSKNLITSWYRKYSDGWIEQGGYVFSDSNLGYIDVTFSIPFVNNPALINIYGELTDDWFTATTTQITGIYSTAFGAIGTTTTTRFRLSSYGEHSWYACGY